MKKKKKANKPIELIQFGHFMKNLERVGNF